MSSALSLRLSREKGESDSLDLKGCVISFVNWGDLACSHGDAPQLKEAKWWLEMIECHAYIDYRLLSQQTNNVHQCRAFELLLTYAASHSINLCCRIRMSLHKYRYVRWFTKTVILKHCNFLDWPVKLITMIITVCDFEN